MFGHFEISRLGLWKKLAFYWVIASTGAVVMALEIMSSRVLAPHFGSSVYVWGSIISVFLGALSIGYFIGGRMADQRPSMTALGRLLLYAAVLEAALLAWGEQTAAWLAELTSGTPAGTLIAVVILFGPVSVLLATPSPYALRLAASDLSELGTTAGQLLAISSIGSLVGTLGCTFILIPNFEVRIIIATLVFITAFTSIVALTAEPMPQRVTLGLACLLMVVVGVQVLQRQELPPNVLLQRITPYQSIQVRTQRGQIHLVANGAHQGVVSAETLTNEVTYIDQVNVVLAYRPESRRILSLGMGGGLTGRKLYGKIPGLELDFVEIDPAIPEIAEQFMGFETSQDRRIHISDARRFLAASNETWDVIFCDTFVGFSVPFHLTTKEFLEVVKERLAPGGLFVANVGSGLGSPFPRAIWRTTLAAFEWTHVYHPRGVSNVVLVSGNGKEPETSLLLETARQLDSTWQTSPSFVQLLERLKQPDIDYTSIPILTDRFAPVESLIPFSGTGVIGDWSLEKAAEFSNLSN